MPDPRGPGRRPPDGERVARRPGRSFLDFVGEELPPGGAALAELTRIAPRLTRAWAAEVAANVTNPVTAQRRQPPTVREGGDADVRWRSSIAAF